MTRWATYLALLTFGTKSRPGAQNVSGSLSRTDLEDIDYQSAKNLELQECLSYLGVVMDDQAVQEQEDCHKDQVYSIQNRRCLSCYHGSKIGYLPESRCYRGSQISIIAQILKKIGDRSKRNS